MNRCACPWPGIQNFGNNDCRFETGMIAKIAFQEIRNATGRNQFTAEEPPTEIASWQTFISATDRTKITISPLVGAVTFEAGTAQQYGAPGDAANYGGIPLTLGYLPTTVTGRFDQITPEIGARIESLGCAPNDSLGVYLIFDGGIAMNTQGATTTQTWYSIPISGFTLSDLVPGLPADPTHYNFTFYLLRGWASNMTLVQPTWNPVTDLVNEDVA